MGIRYYAYPFAAHDLEAAKADPWAFLADDPLADAWGLHQQDEPVPPKPTMLYLDKAWSDLQMLLGPEHREAPRPAYRLVAGDVTFTHNGWKPHVQVLSPADVAEIARDIATVPRDDHRVMADHHGRQVAEYDYVGEYLVAAQQFTADMANSASGWSR